MASPFRRFTNDVGYNPFRAATQKDADAAIAVQGFIMKAIDADPLGPTKVVADGKQAWINRYLREVANVKLLDRDCAEILWRYFKTEHQRRFPNETPSQVLDSHSEVSPLTADEIRQTIKIDSASAPEARRLYYGRDSYDYENAVKKMIDEIPDQTLLDRAAQKTEES